MKPIIRNSNQTASGKITNPDGTAFDLTDKKVEFFIRDGQRVLFYKTNPTGITIPAPATDGNYVVQFLREDTVNLDNGIYDYGLLVRDILADELVYVGGGQIPVVTAGGE